MAVYKLFPTQDATINSEKTESNAGLDAILEVSQYKDDTKSADTTIVERDPWDNQDVVWDSSSFAWNSTPTSSTDVALQLNRYLIQYSTTEINDLVDNYIGSSQWDATLKNYIAYAQGIDEETILEVWPIAYDWDNGSGKTGDTPINKDGVSWKHRVKLGTSERPWPTGSSFTTLVTGSSPNDAPGGGAWYTGSSNPSLTLPKTQSFDTRTFKDLNIGVTDIVDTWYKTSKNINPYTSINNNGFIIKLNEKTELNASKDIQPIFKYYSVDTNTIYPPILEIKWDDYNRNTLLDEVSSQDIYVNLDNNQGEFHYSAVNRFRLNVRPEFPIRTYQTSSLYTTNHVLPENSYYAIKDLDTNEYVVDFDTTYTKISADNTSNYFDVYMNGLEPERYYKILIKTHINEEIIVKDNKYYFKVING